MMGTRCSFNDTSEDTEDLEISEEWLISQLDLYTLQATRNAKRLPMRMLQFNELKLFSIGSRSERFISRRERSYR